MYWMLRLRIYTIGRVKNKMLDKNKLIKDLEVRILHLENRYIRDFGGNFNGSDILALRELKYWLGAIQRNEYDINLK